MKEKEKERDRETERQRETERERENNTDVLTMALLLTFVLLFPGHSKVSTQNSPKIDYKLFCFHSLT